MVYFDEIRRRVHEEEARKYAEEKHIKDSEKVMRLKQQRDQEAIERPDANRSRAAEDLWKIPGKACKALYGFFECLRKLSFIMKYADNRLC